jgi:hypothetical protein
MSANTKKTAEKAAEKVNADLESLAVRLDSMATEANELGEERAVKAITKAAKSVRAANKQRAARFKKVGSIVDSLKAKGLTDAQIVAELTR